MSLLPWPPDPEHIRTALEDVDDNLLKSTEQFVRQQSSVTVDHLASHAAACCTQVKPQYYWLNVLSLFNANQQLNEACNKMWAAVELANITRPSVWKRHYSPVGPEFGRVYVSSTLIPNLYYAQISAMISVLSAFGCVPVIVSRTPFYLIRTHEGWKALNRRAYVRSICGRKVSGWHEQIIETYFAFGTRGIRLPKISKGHMTKLKDLRNEMHYSILGDLKMWRTPRKRNMFAKFTPLVDNTIIDAIGVLRAIKKVSTGCDERYSNLRETMKHQMKLL
jgi:hypothetical protein